MSRVIGQAVGAALRGVEAVPVRVEVDLAGGLPAFHIVGLAGSAVRESRVRVKAALENNGYDLFSTRRVTANLAPANLPKEGTAYDLPIAVAVLEAGGIVPAGAAEKLLFAGELSLSGRLKPIRGALPMADTARALGMTLVVPKGNAAEAAAIPELDVRAVGSLAEVAEALRTGQALAAAPRSSYPLGKSALGPDLEDVRGQGRARRALEIAAAGRHNLLLVGPPGSGKTMLARRLPSVLPEMGLDEAIEATRIHSVAGLTRGSGLVSQRPFRAPHHSASDVALIGGGPGPRPGEVSLAHNGVLFLDELPEFRRPALEALRQPLEDRVVTVARARDTVVFPSAFQLVAAMNPCPCGKEADECSCGSVDLQRYRSKLSAPLLDRIDMMIDVPRVPLGRLARRESGEASMHVRERVSQARAIQQRRYRGRSVRLNAEMGERELAEFAALDDKGQELLLSVAERLRISARVFHRILRVARTIADLAGGERISRAHVSEALLYRSLDRALVR